MRVMGLGKDCFDLQFQEDFAVIESKITLDDVRRVDPDWIVSFGYRHILRKDIIEEYPERIINIHISYLPWNRGASPNIWSAVDETPSGASIHFIDEGIDTGAVIERKRFHLDPSFTLEKSYLYLKRAAVTMFNHLWQDIRSGIHLDPIEQIFMNVGTSHTKAQTKKLLELLQLPDGWNSSRERVTQRVSQLRDEGIEIC